LNYDNPELDVRGVQYAADEIGWWARVLGAAHLKDGTPEQTGALSVASSDLARVSLRLEHAFGRWDE
jgi:hypothetical protein